MLRRLFVVITSVTIGLMAGLVLTGRMRSAEVTSAATASESQGAAQTRSAPAPAAPAALPDLTGIAQRAVSSVTNISSTQVVRTPLTNDPFFRYFFRDDDLYRERRQQSLGSGVVVSADGYVLTNNHVVGSAGADVRVGFSDKRELRAKVIGTDPLTDLAVLKLDATSLPTLGWGDSSKLRVAEWVLAIGNPYQLSETVTLGIVSAVGRTNLGVSTFEDFIQTDAAINPGNSGGALINARGELVGINTVIFSRSGGYQGIGFAVSSNLAQRIFNELRQFREVRRGSIGNVHLLPLTTGYAERFGAPDTRGALVYEMYRDSPSVFELGDIILAFNGTTVQDPGHLDRLMSDAPIGSTATLRILRDGKRLDIRVPIQKRAAS